MIPHENYTPVNFESYMGNMTKQPNWYNQDFIRAYNEHKLDYGCDQAYLKSLMVSNFRQAPTNGQQYTFVFPNAQSFWQNVLQCLPQIQLYGLISCLFSMDLTPYNITSQLKFVSQDLYNNTFSELVTRWNFNKNGYLFVYDLDRILLEITVDKLYFEKLDVEVNRKMFLLNFDENQIRDKFLDFINQLVNSGINYTRDNPTLESIQSFVSNANANANSSTINDPKSILIYKKSEDRIYIGAKVNKKEGFGFSQYDNGHYYGYFSNGKRTGEGIYYFKKTNQTHYGIYTDNTLKDNIVIRFHTDGNNYKQEWIGNLDEDKQLQGYGNITMYSTDHTVKSYYRGYMQNGKLNGYGQYRYTDGNFCEGYFENDLRKGFSLYYFKSCVYSVGNYMDGQLTGYGESSFANGDIYRGILDKKLNGWGYYYFKAIMMEYEGMWVENSRNGYGRKRINKKGLIKIYEGEFKDDKLVKEYVDPNYRWSFNYITNYNYDNPSSGLIQNKTQTNTQTDSAMIDY